MSFGPVDYSSAFDGQSPAQTPFGALAQGFGLGQGVRNDQQQQTLMTQQQQAQQAQAQVIQRLVSNPNASAQDYANAALLVPGMKDQIKQSWDTKNTDQQQAHLGDVSQYFAAIQNNRPDLASALMTQKADAMQASGADPRQVQSLRINAQIIDAHPEFGRTMMGMMLASIPGGDKVIGGATALNTDQRAQDKAPFEIQSAAADASKKSTDATVAAATAPADIQTPTLKNANLEQDKLNSEAKRQVDALDVQIKQANSETERGALVLKRDEWAQKIKDTGAAATTAGQGVLDGINRSLDTIKQARSQDGSFAGTGFLGATYGQIPGTDAYGYRETIKTLQSQQFMSQLQAMKDASKTGASGMGALSEREGDKIQGIVTSLNPNQSREVLNNKLGIVQNYLERAQALAVAAGKAPGLTPNAAGAVVTVHPTYGTVSDADVNRLLAQNPGATREHVMQLLQRQR